MRKIDKLLHISIIPPFLIALTVLTFFVFMNELRTLSELLISRNASPKVVLMVAGTVAPRVLVFSLPLSFLIGILIGLSGLSGEYQITALRACGVPLRRLLRPVLVLGLVVGAATALMSVIILPKTNDFINSLKSHYSVRQATSLVSPRVFNEEFANVVFYLDELSVDRQHWDRVFLADNSAPDTPRIVLAREGTWVTDSAGLRLQLHLQNGTIYEVNRQEPAKDNTSVFVATDIPIEMNRDNGSEGVQDPKAQATVGLWRGSKGTDPAQRREELIELHKRLALPCSVLGFALIGLSMGTFTRQTGRTSGSVLSLVLALLYFVLFGNGMRLAKANTLPPWLGMWGPDIILLGIGVALLINAEQNSWLAQFAATFHWKPRLQALVSRFHLGSVRSAFQRLDDIAISTTGRIARSRFPKVLDSYICRGFLVYLLWSTLVCYALFVVLTLFDLLDDIIRNKADLSLIVRYFTFLTPHILLLAVPLAVLLAILILFGILEKGSEVTAMKAGGWSLYRISLPVFLISGLVCVSIYFMQDYILPYANIRQDALHNQIKGRPAQTFAKERKWIFGQSDRIYNYDYFDPDKDVFVGLNIYEIDLHQLIIKRRIYAKQATISRQGKWTLENGWVRDFVSDRGRFQPIKEETFAFPEAAGYFQKEIFEPRDSSKLTYFDLKDYINYLKQSGYNATELQIQLHMKVSFPLSCFVMALLGVPFSFSMGKKGAFFGISASVVIAISYWGFFRVFEQMGAYGLLSPVLAAWAPNILFGAAGLALLFTIKT
jgi:LPS export ABC transporter permease LptG/LPS export ABC transporter permease LptF